MRVLMVSKALVVGTYQQKLTEIAAHPDVELTAVVPESWREGGFERPAERSDAQGFELLTSPIVANGNFHLFFFPRLGQIMDAYRPDIVHVDEEPYNFATFMAVLQARRRRIPSLFFTWQNLNRKYPLPFAMIERYVYGNVAGAVAGTDAAAGVLREKGYRQRLAVIPQFGVDPERFRPPEQPTAPPGLPFTIGFAGRLVPEKGVELLVDACARLPFPFQLDIIGNGPSLPSIRERAAERGILDRARFIGSVRSTEMPEQLQSLDVLVLPSLTRPNWAEQFGRILVEAMACGVPVVGSTCGEIPDVIGDAGLVVPEGSVDALAAAIQRVHDDAELRSALATRGRARMLGRFTHQHIAAETIAVYREWSTTR